MLIAINQIQIGKRLRGLREAKVVQLMESIRKLGLQTPITVSSRPAKREGGGMDIVAFDLVAGQHRLDACKRLGWTEIECSIVQMSGDERDLWEIDENLCRAELTELECAEHLAKRKAVYERLHPEARAATGTELAQKRWGYATDNLSAASSFAADTAEKTGATDRDIRRSIRRVSKIDEKVRDRIRDRAEIADSGVELDALAQLDPEQQRKAVAMVESGKAAGIRDATRQMAPKHSKEAQLRALREAAPVVARPPITDAVPTDDVDALQALLLTLRGDPRRIAGIPLEKRIGMARTCLVWLNLTPDDLRAP